ncbi:MAG: hypothetical protein ACLU38_00205 [Dysosmobacter sp.]
MVTVCGWMSTYQTSIPGVCHRGCCPSVRLAYVAAATGRPAWSTWRAVRRVHDADPVRSSLSGRPEIAAGTDGAEAMRGIPAQDRQVRRGRTPRRDRRPAGASEVRAHAETGAILGAHHMCPNASDIIRQQAIANGRTPGSRWPPCRPHPTYEEALSEALENLASKL